MSFFDDDAEQPLMSNKIATTTVSLLNVHRVWHQILNKGSLLSPLIQLFALFIFFSLPFFSDGGGRGEQKFFS